jgi:hypothetical protein
MIPHSWNDQRKHPFLLEGIPGNPESNQSNDHESLIVGMKIQMATADNTATTMERASGAQSPTKAQTTALQLVAYRYSLSHYHHCH